MKESKFQNIINYENLLGQQINRIAEARTKKHLETYEEAVDTLVFMLPSKMRQDAVRFKDEHGIQYDMSYAGKMKYDKLWMHCNKLLEEGNLIFKVSNYDTFQF